jgi:hypothetical protein
MADRRKGSINGKKHGKIGGETYFGTSSINGGFMMFMAYHRHQAIKPCLWQSHRSFANFGGQADDSFFIFIF